RSAYFLIGAAPQDLDRKPPFEEVKAVDFRTSIAEIEKYANISNLHPIDRTVWTGMGGRQSQQSRPGEPHSRRQRTVSSEEVAPTLHAVAEFLSKGLRDPLKRR